jgi:hypothetical protein
MSQVPLVTYLLLGCVTTIYWRYGGWLLPFPIDSELVQIVVLGESWPVWQQVLTKSRGFSCAAVYTYNESVLLKWPDHLQTTHWASIHKFSLANHSDTAQYALVGSNQFGRCYLPALPPSARVLVCLHLQQSPWPEVTGPSWFWVSIAHSSCGGVTTGRYWCGVTPAHTLMKGN